jgi:lipopolysaccharide assembly outer membrane protein LptD (OstA)
LLRALALVLALCTGWSVTAVAQLPTLPPPKPPVSGLTPRDTIPRTAADSARARKDTVATKDTVVKANFAPPDSVLQRLLSTPGYTPTRYQGEVITFDAVTRALQLTKKAVVQRGDSVLVKSDTISYNGSGSDIRVGTDSSKRGNLFVTSGQAPVFSSGSATYDLNSRRASVSGLKTTIPQSGEVLTITGERVTIAASKDTVKTKDDATYYVKNGTVTACDDSVPDYHFSATEIKRTGSFVVARPAVLYIGDVPVLWLPFLFQDIRSGRRSGLIAPNIGVSDIVRNSPSYRRNVEGLGYYVAINDYFDAQAALDWRSSAGETLLGDPGYMRYNGEFRYRWLERYVQGGVALSQTTQAGSRNTAISWTHGEQFTRNSSLQFNFNYVQNTTLQQQTTVNPYAVLATIASTANYQQKIGPAQISVGASQKQYPGRTELDRNFPTVSFTTAPLNLGSALTWTPSFNYASTLSKDIDQPSALGPLLRAGKTAAGLDTVFNDSTKRSAKTSTLTFDSPVVIFGYNIGLNLGLNSALNDFPEREIVTDVLTGVETERVYAQTYHTELNINPTFSLPALSRNSLNLGWSLSLANVDGSAYAIRNERTNGEWVHQSKRVSLGLSAAPTLFGMYEPGIGPFMKIRHSISPTLSFSFAPASDVSDQFLAAIGRSRYSRVAGQSGYLGALRQSSVTFGLSTNFEAKLRSLTDSNPDAGEKLKLLSLNFTPISYDFERAKATNSRIRGLTTQNFGYTIRSDLLPGVDIGVDYSLFSGSTLSDSAVFDPYRERITASWAFSNTANPFSVLAKIFGRQAATSTIDPKAGQAQLDDKYREQVQSQQVAGSSNRRSLYAPTIPQGWNASFNFTSARQRPPTGNALNVVAYDPAVQCSQFNTQALKVVYDECVARARTNPTPTTPITSGISGSTIYLTPPTTSLGSNVSFNLTEHWSASWQTQYDFEARNFASQVVSLQRDLHDWHAIFGFTQSPNGSFAFNFLVSLKAEPDLKFDYHKSTFRNEGIGR